MIASVKKLQVIDSSILAEYILANIGKASHLKIQKLLYYVQGYHLAYFDAPIIEDDFQAWAHGPVSKKLFNSLKDKSILHTDLVYKEKEDIESILTRIAEYLSEDQMSLINEVLKTLWGFSWIELEEYTHAEAPWISARVGYALGDKCEVVISKESMKAFFKTQIYA